jgi:hypothetical protein
LLGRYYRNAHWSGKPVDVQIDPMIDFDWSKTLPLPPPFSIEWRGWLLVELPGEYQFALKADDGAYLEIDGRRLIDATKRAFEEKNGRKFLRAGLHPIRIGYFNDLFGGLVHVWWTLTGRPKEIIPSEALVPEGSLPNGGREIEAR